MTGFTVEIDRNPWLAPDATRVDVLVTVTGPAGQPETVADVLQVVVVDCSGSMLGDKIERARAATTTALAALPDGTLFAVVAGTSQARPVYPAEGAARADGRTRAEAVAAVGALRAGGGTRLGAWLDAVRDVAEQHPGAVRHALLVTDGRNAESRSELHAAVQRCRGKFTCDCRGIGTDWEVAELRTIATALLGDVDIVADAADLPDDLARVFRAAVRRSVPGVVLRLWSPEQVVVRGVTQVAPEVRELTGSERATGPCGIDVPLGDWGAQTREYHLRIDVPPRPVGDRMLAVRVAAGPQDDPGAGHPVVVTRTDDPALLAVEPPRLEHYRGQVALAGAVRDGLSARHGGDDATATLLLGHARDLAERTGHHDTLSLLDDVLHGDAGPVEEMTLDARGRRSRSPDDD
ncbi:VWA domain-containing protein [Pseudonocardia endophytica]|uniref:von Willebrand factor type A domain-containing protein n=1 Tax=Pseudonocardia endophytica TaxID=401976 RepID=A0A4R1HGY9_PSEEN|nr:vWA domain-containing protein [Pseudonocardia endophytica]TCK20988.1 von Willebrand factor type A domain-containing protein [Pseudonocardia endophytica]